LPTSGEAPHINVDHTAAAYKKVLCDKKLTTPFHEGEVLPDEVLTRKQFMLFWKTTQLSHVFQKRLQNR
jgi:hypothetical protein